MDLLRLNQNVQQSILLQSVCYSVSACLKYQFNAKKPVLPVPLFLKGCLGKPTHLDPHACSYQGRGCSIREGYAAQSKQICLYLSLGMELNMQLVIVYWGIYSLTYLSLCDCCFTIQTQSGNSWIESCE